MSTRIDVDRIAKDGRPRDEGTQLAKVVLTRTDTDWSDLTLDMRFIPLRLHNIAFFYGFLQEVFDTKPELLECARRAHWLVRDEELAEMIGRYTTRFQPQTMRQVIRS